MNKEQLVEQYRKLLASHDWYYDYSDDYRVWKRGNDNRWKLVELQMLVDQDGAIWNEYAPSDRKVRAAA